MQMPLLRKLGNYNVYYEGWALYTEKLAYEQGFYSSSFAQLGHLADELFRAARLVVDTGIHHKRWSREQAIDYMVQVTGMPKVVLLLRLSVILFIRASLFIQNWAT